MPLGIAEDFTLGPVYSDASRSEGYRQPGHPKTPTKRARRSLQVSCRSGTCDLTPPVLGSPSLTRISAAAEISSTMANRVGAQRRILPFLLIAEQAKPATWHANPHTMAHSPRSVCYPCQPSARAGRQSSWGRRQRRFTHFLIKHLTHTQCCHLQACSADTTGRLVPARLASPLDSWCMS